MSTESEDRTERFLELRIKQTRKIVERWRGYPAGMFSLRSPHAALHLVVFGDEAGHNLVITCIHPQNICGPFRWGNSEISVKLTQLKDGRTGVSILDEKNGLLVTAESFEVSEHLKKLDGVLIPPKQSAL